MEEEILQDDHFNYFIDENGMNIYGGSFGLFQRIKDLIKNPIRLNYPPSYREFLEKHRNLLITEF